ncbi:MAG: class I SAM-dependent methyltransferase, partial [Candidatus Aenigmatarchaeota archaeon]
GCGTGYFSGMFGKKDYVGIDVDGPAIAYARKRHTGYTFLQYEKRCPFPDCTFDNILINAVFHHIPDRMMGHVLADVLRVAKPEAKVLVMDTVPVTDQRSWWGRFLFSRDQGRDAKGVAKMTRMLKTRFSIRHRAVSRTGPYVLQIYHLTPKNGHGHR